MTLPLSEQLRPGLLSDVFGQDHLLGPQGLITQTVQNGKPLSILLWGPPGCGKTSIARLYAAAFNMRFVTLSAIFSGVSELKRILQEMEQTPLLGRSSLLFVDEVHRFNKAQQDAFLPLLENGTLVLIAATAENPSFYLNDALLSRLRVLKLKPLQRPALERILENYERHRAPLCLDRQAREHLIELAQGDGRYLLNLVENIESIASSTPLSVDQLEPLLQQRAPLFDKQGDGHYMLISALHKSVRGSDPDAALYWLSRMLEAGEEPLFIARRLIRMASEEIGLADPQALSQALAARSAYEALGSPEGELALAQATVYLALAPKSNALYQAYGEAKEQARQSGSAHPPALLLNAPTPMMKRMGYGQGYRYDHDTLHGFSGQNYFPPQLGRPRFYHPYRRGFEREMCKRLDYFAALREKLGEGASLKRERDLKSGGSL